ncbi:MULTISPECIES: c-type cytochrome [Sphingopyxis]|uniref:c-type cytochrome n=1 Tax=Sphingopyxis TaxID=165697 RepID=UPI0006AD4EB7|nr:MULTISPECIES: c-type cytochrome [Sphingopyxis]
MNDACKLTVFGSVGAFLVATLTVETDASAKAPAAPAAFARCAACHSVVRGAPNKMGPNLAGIVGSKAATRPGGRYSPALKKSGIVWNKANLAAYLKNTQTTVPGTTMPNPNISKTADSDAIIAYLTASK